MSQSFLGEVLEKRDRARCAPAGKFGGIGDRVGLILRPGDLLRELDEEIIESFISKLLLRYSESLEAA
ncbi:hypothetical protein D3C83_157970 [compost metagenome]